MTLLSALYGGLTMMCILAAVFFLRYWRLSRDRFFVWFATAFLTFAGSWALLAHDGALSEHSQDVYVVRLAGFIQIIAAIVMKNRHPVA